MGDDTSKALIVELNNGAGVHKNSDHLTPSLWQPLEVTTSCFVCVCVFIKGMFLFEEKGKKETWQHLEYSLITVK